MGKEGSTCVYQCMVDVKIKFHLKFSLQILPDMKNTSIIVKISDECSCT